MNPLHPNCRSVYTCYKESPAQHVKRLTIRLAATPWYKVLSIRSQQRRLKTVLMIYKGKL